MKCACAILSSVACPTLRYFFILFHKEHDFRKNKLNVKCGFWVSLQILSATFLIRRRIKQDIIINVYWSSMYSYLSDFNENWIFWTDFRKKNLNVKFYKNPSSENRVVPWGRTDTRMDWQVVTKLIFAFRNFASTPNIRQRLAHYWYMKKVSNVCICAKIPVKIELSAYHW